MAGSRTSLATHGSDWYHARCRYHETGASGLDWRTNAQGGEAYQASTGGKFGVLDAASNAIGAGIGSLVTDRFILMPVVRRERASTQYGVMAGYAF